MADKKPTTLMPARDPFALMRQMTSELDRLFERSLFGPFRMEMTEAVWSPKIDVVEKDGRLITRIDLPGMKKEDLVVEASEGRLMLSGERKRESEETKTIVTAASASMAASTGRCPCRKLSTSLT